MRFLVTGATGFVGSHIAHKLLENGHDVNVLVRKTSNTRNIQGFPLKVVYGDLRDKDSLKKAAFDCASDAKKLGLDPGPVKLAFEKSIRWFKENGYVKN